MRSTILVVEDNQAIRIVIKEFLSLLVDTTEVTIVTTDKQSYADEVLKTDDVALLITDINLGVGGDGISLVQGMDQNRKRPYVIVMSSIEWLQSVQEYLKSGLIDSFLNKPFSLNELKQVLVEAQVVQRDA